MSYDRLFLKPPCLRQTTNEQPAEQQNSRTDNTMSNIRPNKRRKAPSAPKYESTTLGELLEKGAPPLNTVDAHQKSSAHTKPTVPKIAKVVVKSTCPPAQLPALGLIPESLKSEYSQLLDEARSSRYDCTYDTEADVQDLVRRLVKDALRIMGLEYDCKVRLELSVFSLRPDIIVLHHTSLGILLIIQIKKPDTPGSKQDSVFNSPKVAGQLFDYLMGMYNLVNATPFAVLSTYKHMTIAWLDTPRSNEIMQQQVAAFSSQPVLPPDEVESADNETAATSPAPVATERSVPSQAPLTSVVKKDDCTELSQ
eukprot:scaffold192250_cov49-Attheya_sp.AAC.1